MKIEYHLTPHRVIQCHVHLLENLNVDSVLQACVWMPPVLRVHIETQRCCTESKFHFTEENGFIDARLSRFVAVEESCFEMTCHACGRKQVHVSNNLSLLHWRSQAEVKNWNGMPWFTNVMQKTTFTSTNGQEEPWCDTVDSATLTNQAPTERLAHTSDGGEAERLKEAMCSIRQCVHPRLQPYMNVKTGKVYVAFRQKREMGFYFMVRRRPRCLAWSKQPVHDTCLVIAAASCTLGNLSLEQFMKAVVQVVAVGPEEYMMVVNWLEDVLPTHVWIGENKVHQVHGMQQKWPMFFLALGATRPVTLYHGTSSAAAEQIVKSGFESNAFHSCSGTYYKCNPPFACCCKGMLGPGVYCASFEKASSNAGRVAGANVMGTVLECQLLVGECKFVTPWSPELCQCGCRSLYSDHIAAWYHEQMFDSIYLCAGAGVKREELCVRRPKRVVPVHEWLVKYNDQRVRVHASKR